MKVIRLNLGHQNARIGRSDLLLTRGMSLIDTSSDHRHKVGIETLDLDVSKRGKRTPQHGF